MDFVAKQMVGKQLGAVKGAVGGAGEDEDPEVKRKREEEEAAIAEARREAEELRRQKHEKMEAEREVMRQGIRDKYNIKKKEEPAPVEDPVDPGRIGRKKKTPEEMKQEAEEDDDSLLSQLPIDLKSVQEKVGDVTEKCSLM